ncbi:MAG: hypothetical protein JNM17_35720 [Archangium sp.]|nr:hypothetical protein [Archangium sp.]
MRLLLSTTLALLFACTPPPAADVPGGGSATGGGETGGGTAAGGGIETGGGTTTGGGTATGGGTGGGTAIGGGSATTDGGTAIGGGSATTGGGTAIGGGSATTGGGTATGGGTSTFVSLADSIWGTSAIGRDNLMQRVAPNHAYDNLPLNTSTWATDTTLQNAACSADNTTVSAILARELAVSPRTRIILPNCDIALNVDTQPLLIGRRDFIEYVGQANTRFVMRSPAAFDTASGDLALRAPRLDAFRFSTSPATFSHLPHVAACAWTGGYEMGGRRVQLDSTCAIASSGANAWGVGDLVYLETDTFPGVQPHGSPISTVPHRLSYRVTCVDGAVPGPSDRVGTAAGCSELTGDHQLQLDRPRLMDYRNGVYFMGGPSLVNKPTGHVVRQMERVGTARGGAGTETNNLAEYVGFRNIKWYRPDGYLYNSGSAAIRFGRIADGWIVENEFQRWGNAWLAFNEDSSRVLLLNNRYTAPVNRARCVGEVANMSANPSGDVRLTLFMDVSVSDCDVQSDATEGRVYLGPGVSEPSLRDRIRRKAFVSATTTAPRTVTIDLPGVRAAGLTLAPGGLVSVLNNWNVASTYVNGPANSIHFVGEYYQGSRMGPLLQGGAAGVVMAYGWMEHADTEHCSRGFFLHGNVSAPGTLVEGNRLDCPITPWATSNRGDDGEGLNVTFFKNRLVNTGPERYPDGLTGAASWGGGGLTRGRFDIAEQTSQNGAANENFNFLSNVFAEFFTLRTAIDDVANDGNGGAAVPPYALYMPTLLRNRCTEAGCDLDDNLDTMPQSNPTTWAPDIRGGDVGESPRVPDAWRGEHIPTSLYYRADQLVNGRPSWWCAEAAPFGAIGAHFDDLTAPETITAARIIGRREPCTRP